MKNILGIYDDENEYCERLSNLLGSNEAFPYEVSPYSSIELLTNDMKSGKLSCALVAERALERYSSSCDGPAIVLDEGYNKSGTLRRIWKYQSGDTIRKEILNILIDNDDNFYVKNASRKKTSSLTVFFSPSHQRENSSLSVLYSNLLTSGNNKKVLHLSFTSYSGFDELINQTKDITELLYFMENTDEDKLVSTIGLKLQSIAYTNGQVDYIAPAYSYQDIINSNKESVTRLITYISDCRLYDHIVIDATEVIEGLEDLLYMADKIYCFLYDTGYDFNVKSRLCQILKDNDKDILTEKIKFITIPESSSYYGSLYELCSKESSLWPPITKIIKEE